MTRVYKWEILKLLAQKRTYLGLGAAVVVPVIFVVVLQLQSGGPNDVPLASRSGYRNVSVSATDARSKKLLLAACFSASDMILSAAPRIRCTASAEKSPGGET